MGIKAEEMKELMGRLEIGPKVESVSLSESEVEARSPLPPEILVNAKQDRIHTEKRSTRKVVVKRIHFR